MRILPRAKVYMKIYSGMRIFTNHVDCQQSYLRSYTCVPHVAWVWIYRTLHAIPHGCKLAPHSQPLEYVHVILEENIMTNDILNALLTENWSMTNGIPKAWQHIHTYAHICIGQIWTRISCLTLMRSAITECQLPQISIFHIPMYMCTQTYISVSLALCFVLGFRSLFTS